MKLNLGEMADQVFDATLPVSLLKGGTVDSKYPSKNLAMSNLRLPIIESLSGITLKAS